MDRPPIDDPDLPISALVAAWPGVAAVFARHAMHCPACPIARFHTVADACADYGLEERAFRAALAAAAKGDG